MSKRKRYLDKEEIFEKEKEIRIIYYWDARKGGEDALRKGIPVSLKDLEKDLENELRMKKEYYEMSSKSRRFGLNKALGKSYNEKIKVFRELIKEKKRVNRSRTKLGMKVSKGVPRGKMRRL